MTSLSRRIGRRSVPIVAGLSLVLLPPLSGVPTEAVPQPSKRLPTESIDAAKQLAQTPAAAQLARRTFQWKGDLQQSVSIAKRHWPTAKNTGASGHLRRARGRTITRDGVTIKNRLIRGQITVRADNVTLRNVHVRTRDWYGVLVYGKHLRIVHSTIEGSGDQEAGLAALEGGQFVAKRINVYGTEDGVRLTSRSRLRHSFIHHLRGESASHFDSVTADGHRRWRIVHNRILNQHGQTAAVWVGDPRYGPSSGLLRNNYLAGGGYTIYGGHSVSPGIRVVNNVFSTRYFRDSGYYGPVAYWRSRGNTWSGNIWIDGRRKHAAVRP